MVKCYIIFSHRRREDLRQEKYGLRTVKNTTDESYYKTGSFKESGTVKEAFILLSENQLIFLRNIMKNEGLEPLTVAGHTHGKRDIGKRT